jgi:hypothetical protein
VVPALGPAGGSRRFEIISHPGDRSFAVLDENPPAEGGLGARLRLRQAVLEASTHVPASRLPRGRLACPDLTRARVASEGYWSTPPIGTLVLVEGESGGVCPPGFPAGGIGRAACWNRDRFLAAGRATGPTRSLCEASVPAWNLTALSPDRQSPDWLVARGTEGPMRCMDEPRRNNADVSRATSQCEKCAFCPFRLAFCSGKVASAEKPLFQGPWRCIPWP